MSDQPIHSFDDARTRVSLGADSPTRLERHSEPAATAPPLHRDVRTSRLTTARQGPQYDERRTSTRHRCSTRIALRFPRVDVVVWMAAGCQISVVAPAVAA